MCIRDSTAFGPGIAVQRGGGHEFTAVRQFRRNADADDRWCLHTKIRRIHGSAARMPAEEPGIEPRTIAAGRRP